MGTAPIGSGFETRPILFLCGSDEEREPWGI